MNTPKEAAAEIIHDLPDNATYDDIMYHLYVRAKIERAMKDVNEGNLIEQEEVEEMMKKWIIE
ncbi:MAG: hypothetical protein P9X24_17445 [Candidatus Hatepunaea meridiana]|nr:hypothetical protein [Candidatus Hatepunaea meridiana]